MSDDPKDFTKADDDSRHPLAPGQPHPKSHSTDMDGVSSPTQIDSRNEERATSDPYGTAHSFGASDKNRTLNLSWTEDELSPAPLCIGDYQILAEIARGGMGIVYKAKQKSLGRIVALKMLLSGQLSSEHEIKRFWMEAEAAANLDHSGIVPVYEVGNHRGQSYYIMPYIEGESLSKRLSTGPMHNREAALLIKQVAEAIQFAHDRGIVHRDLKPANVLIGTDGKPRVTDFGLAKRKDVDQNITGTGQVLGTPGYMAPEQASGRTKEVGASADIYSLGATLYAMITARPPFQAASVLETIKQIVERDPISPRSLNPSVERDLDIICLKCLEKSPAKRYQTAQEIADELGRFLRGEPIHARRINFAERAARKIKRHPLQTTVVVLALLFLGIASAFGLNLAVLRASEKQRQLAEQTFAAANDAVKEFEDIEKDLAKDVRLRKYRSRIRQAALRYYQRLANNWENDPDHLPQLAEAQFESATSLKIIGTTQQTDQAFKTAVGSFQNVVDQNRGDNKSKARLAHVTHEYGVFLNGVGEFDAARREYEVGKALWKEILAPNPQHESARNGLARSYGYLGDIDIDEGKLADAEAAYLESHRLREQLVVEQPGVRRFQFQLARSHGNLARLEYVRGNLAASIDRHHKARAIQESLIKEANPRDYDPDVAECKSDLVGTYTSLESSLGWDLADLGKIPEATDWYNKGKTLCEELVSADRGNLDYQVTLARCEVGLAALRKRQKQYDLAKSHLANAIEHLSSFDSDMTDSTFTRANAALSRVHRELASVAALQNDAKTAEVSFATAIKIMGTLITENPGNLRQISELAAIYGEQCEFNRRRANFENARQDMKLARAQIEKCLLVAPNNKQFLDIANQLQTQQATLVKP